MASSSRFTSALAIASLAFLVSLASLGSNPASAAARSGEEYQVKIESRLGYHLVENRDLATHRHRLEVAYDRHLNSIWTFHGAARASAEAAYSANPDRFGSSIGKTNSSELHLRDFYLDGRASPWQLRIGNQQVVWGETFGFYYADIINPKDLREMGLWDFESQRTPLPMLQIKYLRKSHSLQGIVIPRPGYHKMPQPGSDFFPQSLNQAGGVTIADEPSPAWRLSNVEVGARYSTQINSVDLSAFGFYYYDRTPNYTASLASLQPLTIRLTPEHRRIFSMGLTGTADVSSFLLRWEAVYTPSRWFNSVENGTLATHSSGEMVYVLGADYTGLGSWHSGMQVSRSHRFQDRPGALQAGAQTLVSLLLNGTIWHELSLESTTSYMISDRGWLTQLRLVQPLTRSVELQFGADALAGPRTSQFGQFREATRGLVVVKAFLGK